MKKIAYLFLGTLILIWSCKDTAPKEVKVEAVVYENNVSAWREVDSLIGIQQTKTALEKVDAIWLSAKKISNYPEQIKSLIYRTKLYSFKDEESTIKGINEFSLEIKDAPAPYKQLLHSVLAELYWKYYQENRWVIMDRTVVDDFTQEDIRTWDAKKHFNEVRKHYLASIEASDETKNISTISYKTILEGDENIYAPTLYDFLAQRALFFFKSNEPDLAQSSFYFEMDNPKLLSDVVSFMNLPLESKDSTSSKLRAIRIFQDLLKFHSKDLDKSTLVTLAIRRASFIYEYATFENKDELYLQELKRIAELYADNIESHQAIFLKAQYLYEKGLEYKKDGNEDQKGYIKESLAISESVIAAKENSLGRRNCQLLANRIRAKNIIFKIEGNLIPNQDFKILTTYRNLDKVFVRVVKTTEKEYASVEPPKSSNRSYTRTEDYIDFYKLKESNQSFQTNLILDGYYHDHSTELALKGLPIGHYIVLIGSDSSMNYDIGSASIKKIQVTSLAFLTRKKPNGIEVLVMDRKSGEPVSGAKVKVNWRRNVNRTYHDELTSLITNNEGFTFFETNEYVSNPVYLEISKPGDVLKSDRMYAYFYKPTEEEFRTQTHFFTDRAIYRPGQTVYFKGIVMKSKRNEHEILAKSYQSVDFLDANHQEIASLDLKTNDFGSFKGSFVIPQGRMNGIFRIKNSSGGTTIQVEEYKRPKFEVIVNPFIGDYQLNDSINVTGFAKALAGNSISGAKVVYRVVRTANWSWWSRNSSTSREITHGVLETNVSGKFNLSFLAVPDNSVAKDEESSFTYEILIDVTDISGETRSSSTSVTVGYKSLVLGVDIPAQLRNSIKTSFQLTTSNLNGVFSPSKGQLIIRKLKDPQIPFTESLWEFPDMPILDKATYRQRFPLSAYGKESTYESWEVQKEVFNQTFDTEISKKIILNNLNEWEQGFYEILLKSKDKYGKEVVKSQYVTLFDIKNSSMPTASQEWLVPLQGQVKPGEKASFLIGSSLKQKVLVEVEQDNKIIKKYWLALDNEQKVIDFPVTEVQRGGFAVHFTFAKENRIHQLTEVINVPFTNKELKIQFETFRDKLQPGQKEEWRLKIEGPEGDKIASEFVATLYDASLDQFMKHRFGMSLYHNYLPSFSWDKHSSTRVVNFDSKSNYPNYSWGFSGHSYSYQQLNWFGFNSFYTYQWYGGRGLYEDEWSEEEAVEEMSAGGDRGNSAPGRKSKMVLASNYKMEAGSDFKFDAAITEIIPPVAPEGQVETINASHIRSNFNETAFFYPELKTDEKGAVIIKFTIPESLTRWKMLGLAHTKDLKVGIIENELVTQKELMITANAPRFFREGDKILFSAKVSNLADKELEGSAKLELFDALTMKSINTLLGVSNDSQNFKLKKEGNEALVWEITIPETVQAITYRISAKAEKHTDAEEMTVPVLSDRMLVTESMTLAIRGQQSKTFTLDKLASSGNSTTLKNHKLTLEFTSNPAWYAIQALPYLMEYPYECSEQTFSRLYANSIASHIVNSNPKIKQVFDQWKNQTPDALLSNLEKNQELKSLLLQETPWVRDAKGESERKRRVAILFDLNKMANEKVVAIDRLEKLQTGNGGWSWFDGMNADRYITQHILTGFGKMKKLGVLTDDSKVNRMVESGLSYSDKSLKEDYKELKRLEELGKIKLEDNHIGYTQIHHLYMRSFFTENKVSKENKEAYNYYYGQAVKYWNQQSTYMQGMIAVALYRAEEKMVSQLIVRAFRENALHSEELGTYWKGSSGYYWYQAPIESQTMMAEVFREVAEDQKMLEGIQVWLIKNKQTNDWKTTKATVEACYVLLMDDTKWVSSEEQVKIKVGGNVIDPKKLEGVKIEAGTGYFKTSWSSTEIKPSMGEIELEKSTDGVAFGALYWQYFEQLDKITPAETPLRLNKKLFLEKKTDAGLILTPIDDNINLTPGDRVIVRIELQVDRAMEYIHLKDMRASALEPENVISSYKYQGGLGYYESTKDASTNFFISFLPKGTFVFEYPLRVTHKGDFSNGITSVQCMYAPEFSSHSEGVRLIVK